MDNAHLVLVSVLYKDFVAFAFLIEDKTALAVEPGEIHAVLVCCFTFKQYPVALLELLEELLQ